MTKVLLLVSMALALVGPSALAKSDNAEALIANETKRFQAMFAKTSGFKSVEEFEASLNSHVQCVALLQNLKAAGLVEVVSFHGSEIRDAVASKGFLNIYQTHSSGGSIDNEALRMTAEANMLGLSIKEYKALPNGIKGKSAMLQAKSGETTLQIPNPNSLVFGDDGYIFKSEKLAKRMTWTQQDALDRYIRGNKISVKAVHPDNIMPEDRTPDMKFLGNPAKSWDQTFIPWTANSLLIPYIIPYLIDRSVVASSGTPYILNGAKNTSKSMKSEIPSQQLKISKDWVNGEDGYVEVQIWGPLTLDDVEAFQFSKTPPSGAFLQALVSRGIEIRDARAIPVKNGEEYTLVRPKIWTPGMP